MIPIIGAGVEWVVGQTVDKFWTNVQYLSKICQSFANIQYLSKFWLECPMFVNYLSIFCTKFTNCPNYFNDGQTLNNCLSIICPMFVHNSAWAEQKPVCLNFVQVLSMYSLSNVCPIFFQVLSRPMQRSPTQKFT